MNCIFKKVILHNFLSYGHAEIDLTNRSYCIVRGINRCPKDNAISNGAGKSSWISAICWALTGQTIQGITKDIKNIYVPENSCYVTLLFSVDNVEYELTRTKEPTPNLKILVNGDDKSGKGIRESEAVLAQLLPDITKDLLGNVILIGQGMPNKFTNNTPAGRKEVLEKLSKSDFMIQDIKDRIAVRHGVLSDNLRKEDDKIISISSQLDVYNKQLIQANQELEELMKPVNFDEDINNKTISIETNEKLLADLKANLNTYNEKFIESNNQLNVLKENRINALSAVNEKYVKKISDNQKETFELQTSANSLSAEIIKLESIKDVCPTCGRPFEGVVKPDTTEHKNKLSKLNESITLKKTELKTLMDQKNSEMETVGNEHDKSIKELNDSISKINSDIYQVKSNISPIETCLVTLKSDLATLKANKQNHLTNIENTKVKVGSYKVTIEELTKQLEDVNKAKADVLSHLGVISKMTTLVQRDFRGFLLSNVIEYIESRAKDYCKDVFGTDEFEFKLNGNNLDILYCEKPLESLSGGEQQRINIIIQFALRDMMKQFLGFSSNILVMDEIFDALDVSSTTTILNLISTRLTDIESIFIISHHDDLEIPYDSELVVEKGADCISFIQ